jgi:eukaryotic-like serine/threonine-protein kinase
MRLELNRGWELGERIAGGGFATVYRAESDDAEAAVVKLIPKAPGADRELLFVDLHDARNVVPVIDSGETEAHYAIVMPEAEKSLRTHLEEAGGSLPVSETIAVLSDIARALVDLESHVVHRDLKPENVLLLRGAWCVADFGISRYADATTAPDTRKFAMTPPYAAPEQWRGDHATPATDIYAVGVIGYEALAGVRPFPGPEPSDYRDQHLHQDPPPLTAAPSRLASIIEECLYKAPGARPAAANLLARLERAASDTSSAGASRLLEAHRADVGRRAEQARNASLAASETERRSGLFDAAGHTFERIGDAVRAFVVDNAPNTSVNTNRFGGFEMVLGQGGLWLVAPTQSGPQHFGLKGPSLFDVIAHASIGVGQPATARGYEGRSHSLWYCDAQEEGRYGWYETSFMVTPMPGAAPSVNPFALPPDSRSAGALAPGMAEAQVAWPFTRLEVDELGEFTDRWADWFGATTDASLQPPMMMPERAAEGTWRIQR